MTRRSQAAPCLFFCVFVIVRSLGGQVLDQKFSGMWARSIGPAGMSGRITAIDAVVADPDIIYVGAATGGLWKSINGGQTWSAVFDDQPVLSIGAVAIDQSNPNVVWVGTGEGNPRNSAGIGAGIYRSIDGGENWALLGLEHSERIHRILLHPTDPAVAYVGAMGPAWSDGEERGVFKTTDGGITWERILFVDERTGVGDMVMDPTDPEKLFVGMWSFRRSPWFFESGGPGSGLYVTLDGGETWKRMDAGDGFPEGEYGRIGLAVSPSAPHVVYALIEAAESALLRSTDGGLSWRTIRSGPGVNPRPFYYSDIFVDPEDEQRVFQLHSRLEVSEDGGESFETVGSGVHPAYQALWISPDDPTLLYAGTDGGFYVSRDRGKHWRMIENLPVGQFYRISVDDEIPFSVYGGMQDNGSWKGPSDRWESGGIRNYHWREVASGTGFGTIVDARDPNYGYAMSQAGKLIRFELSTGERKQIPPWAPEASPLRFNWNAPLATDPHDPGVIYYGSQFVHKSVDRGDTWQIISADLTTNDPQKQSQDQSGGLTRESTGAENHTTIVTVAPSPLERDVIWAGTDDGNVQLTRSGGGQWENLTGRMDAVPAGAWVAHIEPSKFNAGAAFAVFDDHRRGNREAYVYRTDDYGRRWRRIADEDDIEGFVHIVRQDPIAEGLLFAGTEFGLYMSLNGGEDWVKWTNGIPAVPVYDLLVHPRDHDLVVATHGRALYVIDDIRPLRELTLNPWAAESGLYLSEPPPAYLHHIAQGDGYHFPADAMFHGSTKTPGALLSYWVSAEQEDSVTIQVLDFDDKVVRSFQGSAHLGLNRVSWDLREDLPEILQEVSPEAGGLGPGLPRGAEVLPGRYTVRLRGGGYLSDRTLEVHPDPRVEIPMIDRIAKYMAVKTSLDLEARVGMLAAVVQRVLEGVDGVEELVGTDESVSTSVLIGEGRNLKRRLEELADFEAVEQYRSGVRSLTSSYDTPTEGQRLDLIRMEEAVDHLTRVIDDFLVLDVMPYRDRVEAANLDVFVFVGPII
ncbi:MAG: hypothetical protein VYD78_06460 [Gemmatimonadota bacterium]|nr:hypothetical protein [Gemmatimonadota bacterium]